MHGRTKILYNPKCKKRFFDILEVTMKDGELLYLKKENERLRQQIEKMKGGRPRTDKEIVLGVMLAYKNGMKKTQIARKFKISRATVYNIIDREKNTQE